MNRRELPLTGQGFLPRIAAHTRHDGATGGGNM
jgi:hypothetical protein